MIGQRFLLMPWTNKFSSLCWRAVCMRMCVCERKREREIEIVVWSCFQCFSNLQLCLNLHFLHESNFKVSQRSKCWAFTGLSWKYTKLWHSHELLDSQEHVQAYQSPHGHLIPYFSFFFLTLLLAPTSNAASGSCSINQLSLIADSR